MARPASEHPTGLELQILEILWDEGSPLTVKQVRDVLADGGRELAHTSVITTMGKMVDKGQLQKLSPTEGKAFRFSPRLKREDVSRNMLGDLKQRVFGGSAEALMVSLFDLGDIDGDEIKRLRRLLNQKLKEQNQ